MLRTDRRRAPRRVQLLTVHIGYFGRAAPTTHVVRDISSVGIGIDNPGALASGQTILVSVGDLEAVVGTVIWINESRAGIAFLSAVPIDPPGAKEFDCVRGAEPIG